MFLLSDYDYDLPEELISQMPAKRREHSRLLCLNRKTGDVGHHAFVDICDILSPSDVLVVNNTEVIPARLFGRKESGGKAEFLILDYNDGQRRMEETGRFECRCLIKASKRLKAGMLIHFEKGLKAQILDFRDGIYEVRFLCDGGLADVLDEIGHMPLPPYIKRSERGTPFCDDKTAYQTVYAAQKGAIAAPTAGLHFSDELLAKLKAKGIRIVAITLHVGYGTFLPVRARDIRDHRMHSEWYSISEETAKTINAAKAGGSRIVAVGTTSVRTLEYAARRTGQLVAGSDHCDLFIYPGYEFKMVDAMVTNFHLPKSTLLMLVSAFAGYKEIQQAYREAIKEKYRFYSYGDAMLIA